MAVYTNTALMTHDEQIQPPWSDSLWLKRLAEVTKWSGYLQMFGSELARFITNGLWFGEGMNLIYRAIGSHLLFTLIYHQEGTDARMRLGMSKWVQSELSHAVTQVRLGMDRKEVLGPCGERLEGLNTIGPYYVYISPPISDQCGGDWLLMSGWKDPSFKSLCHLRALRQLKGLQ